MSLRRKLLAGGLCLGWLGALAQMTAQMPPPPRGPMHPDGQRFGGRGFGHHMDDNERILPPGPWWKDQDLVQRLELTLDQQKRIDDTFLQNRVALIQMHASLDEEELLLGPLLNANPVDQGRTLAEISKIADMRAELEKANARMLLQMRGVLNQAQWKRLQQERPGGMRRHMFPRGQDGSRGPMDPHTPDRD